MSDKMIGYKGGLIRRCKLLIFKYINTLTGANDGMSATITVNQGATYVDVLASKLFGTISSMVFTM